MDDRRFDDVIRALGSGASRRTVLRGLLGLGAGAATASVASERASAARRGFAGPTFPTPDPTPTPPPCAQIGDACGAGCCSGNCCDGTCLVDGACCTDGDCPAGGDCTHPVCSADHVCETAPDPACAPDCSSCDFAPFAPASRCASNWEGRSAKSSSASKMSAARTWRVALRRARARIRAGSRVSAVQIDWLSNLMLLSVTR